MDVSGLLFSRQYTFCTLSEFPKDDEQRIPSMLCITKKYWKNISKTNFIQATVSIDKVTLSASQKKIITYILHDIIRPCMKYVWCHVAHGLLKTFYEASMRDGEMLSIRIVQREKLSWRVHIGAMVLNSKVNVEQLLLY